MPKRFSKREKERKDPRPQHKSEVLLGHIAEVQTYDDCTTLFIVFGATYYLKLCSAIAFF